MNTNNITRNRIRLVSMDEQDIQFDESFLAYGKDDFGYWHGITIQGSTYRTNDIEMFERLADFATLVGAGW